MTPTFRPLAWAAFVALAATTLSVPAQTIYRCGNSYTRVPCAGGKALEVGDPRSAAQRAEARKAAAQERRQAAEMESERRRNEAREKPRVAGTFGPAAAPALAASAPHKHPKRKHRTRGFEGDDRNFRATVPRAAIAK